MNPKARAAIERGLEDARMCIEPGIGGINKNERDILEYGNHTS